MCTISHPMVQGARIAPHLQHRSIRGILVYGRSIRGIPVGHPTEETSPLLSHWTKNDISWPLSQSTYSTVVYRGSPNGVRHRVPIASQYTWHTRGSPNGIRRTQPLSQSTVVYVAYPWVTQWCTAHIAPLPEHRSSICGIPVGNPMVYGAHSTYSTVVYVAYPWVTQWCTVHIAPLPEYLQHRSIYTVCDNK